MDERELLRRTAEIAAGFLESLEERPVFPPASVADLRAALGGPLPDGPGDALRVVEELAAQGERGVVGSPGGRYFGFVIGGALPAALAADWLVSTWDQNAGLAVCGPAAAVAEEVAGEWLRELFGLPATASFAFVTGCQMAHATCLAAARHAVLDRVGWDVERRGLQGAPPIRVLAGAQRHVTVDRALRLLGLGTASIREVAADDQGRMRPEALARALAEDEGPAIVCAQVGEVNTGSIDPLPEIVQAARAAGAWVHVDGAFGLWAAASPALRGRVAGVERADSWATDAHKWLNAPYDCGMALVAHPEPHRAAMGVQAAYLVQDPAAARDQMDWTPEFSRRARGVVVYAALRALGRRGVAELVEAAHARARALAAGVARLPGCELLNEVVLNQVLFRFADDDTTRRVLADVQASGEAWMSGTVWQGRPAIRLSVSNWRTSERDVERTLAAFERALAAASGSRAG
ncbi:MAG TPA: aminotransferase class V-fold PLP-dependent enzyme [Gaiellaceae bacterium]|nr:aminotransferase class V-fold PLP-dependent enzyme [Gaiellaceae bacterium]